jgi:hypothetical protein
MGRLCAEREAASQRGAQPKERATGEQRTARACELRYHRHVAPEFGPHVSSLGGMEPHRYCLSNIVGL